MTEQPTYLQPGDAITRWTMTAPEEQHYPGTVRPNPDHVDYRFVLKGARTGISPAREALAARPKDQAPDFPQGPFGRIYAGGSSPHVDFSQFCHRPTLIARALRCRLRADQPGAATFRLSTCGGVTIWQDKTLVRRFEPFTRNAEQFTTLTLDLPADPVDLTIRLEDLHERDTACFFALRYLSGTQVSASIGTPDASRIDDAAATLESLEAAAVFTRSGPLILKTEHAPQYDLPLEISRYGQIWRGGMAGRTPDHPPIHAILKAGETTLAVLDTSQLPAGCLEMTVRAKIGACELEKRICTTSLPPMITLQGTTIAERKTVAASHIAANPGFEPSVALLLLTRNEQPELARAIVETALTTIEERHDCSDFSIIPLLRIWRDHRETLSEALRTRMRNAFLGYRYWMSEPGSDVMWFWSENHVLCFHIAQYLAGILFPGDTFPNSGRTGRQHEEDAQARLHRWFTSVEAHGLGEWNSAAYYPIDMFALLLLHDMAPDARLRTRAAALLDTIFVMTGLHTTGGIPAGAQGRIYEKEILAGPATELGSMAGVAFGSPWYPGYDRATALFCLSDYEPPRIAARHATPAPDQTISARYTQGLDHSGKLTLWKSAHVQLSTVTEHKTGEDGSQQHLLDVQFAAHPLARLWINHPGDLKPWSELRPSKLAGNRCLPRVAQHGPHAFAIYDLARFENPIPFVQLFAARAAFCEIWQMDNWTFLRSGAGCGGIWCSTPLEPEPTGPYREAVWRANAPKTAWIATLGTAHSDQAFGDFCDRLSQITPRFDTETLTLTTPGLGGTDFTLEFDGPLLHSGTPQTFAPLSPIPHIALNDAPLTPWADHATQASTSAG